MAAISESFDFRISVVQPDLTRGLPSRSKDKINLSGEFNFNPPEQINPTLAPQATQLKPEDEEDTVESLCDALKGQRDQMDRFLSVIDQRCAHLIANYDPNLKSDEAITEACSTIFGVANGVITYSMYAMAIDKLQKLEQFMGHRTVQNEGFLNGA